MENDSNKTSSTTAMQQTNSNGIYKRFFKRPLDVVLSLLAISFLSPVFLITAILVKYKLGSPVIFKQKRPGLNEKIFTMYKFRTMTDDKDELGELLPDSVRLTSFGRMLRSTSLDELPGLINILKGEMSVVGPRPLAVQYLPYYTEIESMRHSVRPGLSGLAQINGRNAATWEDRFAFDVKYVNEISFIGDVKIILKTILKAIQRSDIGERGVNAAVDFDKHRRENPL